MTRYKYNEIKFQTVHVCGITCEYSDVRIDRTSIPQGKYLYEIAGDDDCGDEPTRLGPAIGVNFLGGSVISNEPFPLDEDGVLWLEEDDFT